MTAPLSEYDCLKVVKEQFEALSSELMEPYAGRELDPVIGRIILTLDKRARRINARMNVLADEESRADTAERERNGEWCGETRGQ